MGPPAANDLDGSEPSGVRACRTDGGQSDHDEVKTVKVTPVLHLSAAKRKEHSYTGSAQF